MLLVVNLEYYKTDKFVYLQNVEYHNLNKFFLMKI